MKQMKKSLSGILAAALWISAMSGCAAEKPDSVFQQNMTAAATAPLDEKILLTDTVTSQDGTAQYTIHLNQQLTSAPLPIAEVVPHRLTGEDVKRVAQALFADAPFYEREHEENAAYSKEQLQKRIRWMTELASREALEELFGGEEYVEDTLESLRFWLQKYTVQMETAPTENPHTPCEWTFQKDKHYAASYNSWGDDWIIATVDFGEVNYNVFAVRRDAGRDKLNRISVQFGDGLGNADVEMRYLRAKLCRTPKPTQEQIDSLKEKAQAMLNRMGMGQWEISFADVIEEHYGSATEYQVQLCATPVFQGVPALYGQQIPCLAGYVASDYHISTATFHFSANGDLIYFDLDAPLEIKSIVNDGAAILPMETLLERTKEYLARYGVDSQYLVFFPMEWHQKPLSCKVSVNRLEFGLLRAAPEKKDGSFYYTPAFGVYGRVSYYDKESGEPVRLPSGFPDVEIDRPLIWVNAVDGSLIEEA